VLRDFARRDQRAVRDLILDGLRERWGDGFDPSYNADLEDITSSYVAKGAEVVVFEREGAVIATGTLLSESDLRGRIVRVSVAATDRRRGLGRSVVEELVRRARRRGMRELLVLTDTPWASALALYRACGFVDVAEDSTDTYLAMVL
jgi:ribosomal protein S18 acetylase RimI-like enzyme